MPFTVKEYAGNTLFLADAEMLYEYAAKLEQNPDLKIWVTLTPDWAKELIEDEVAAGTIAPLTIKGQYSNVGTVDYDECVRKGLIATAPVAVPPLPGWRDVGPFGDMDNWRRLAWTKWYFYDKEAGVIFTLSFATQRAAFASKPAFEAETGRPLSIDTGQRLHWRHPHFHILVKE